MKASTLTKQIKMPLIAEKFNATTKDGYPVEILRYRGKDFWVATTLGLIFDNLFAAKMQYKVRYGALHWKRTDYR